MKRQWNVLIALCAVATLQPEATASAEATAPTSIVIEYAIFEPSASGEALHVSLDDNHKFQQLTDNALAVIDVVGETTVEVLPATPSNSNNVPTPRFVLLNEKNIEIHAPIERSQDRDGWWHDWSKCAAGIVGGIGAVGGAAIGGGVGVITGAAGGAAAAC